MTSYLVIAEKYGFEFSVNHYDISWDKRILFSFRIFAGSVMYPWFKYRITASRGILGLELGHGKLESQWIAQGPIKKVA